MSEVPGLVIAGVQAVMSTYFQFRERKSKQVKAGLTINKVLKGFNGLAINISVINKTDKPFSILKLFIERGNSVFEGCRITEVSPQNTGTMCLGVNFRADMFDLDLDEIDKETSFEIFDIHAYLMENQAETGWILFSMKPEELVMNNIGIKISGSEEILYAEYLPE